MGELQDLFGGDLDYYYALTEAYQEEQYIAPLSQVDPIVQEAIQSGDVVAYDTPYSAYTSEGDYYAQLTEAYQDSGYIPPLATIDPGVKEAMLSGTIVAPSVYATLPEEAAIDWTRVGDIAPVFPTYITTPQPAPLPYKGNLVATPPINKLSTGGLKMDFDWNSILGLASTALGAVSPVAGSILGAVTGAVTGTKGGGTLGGQVVARHKGYMAIKTTTGKTIWVKTARHRRPSRRGGGGGMNMPFMRQLMQMKMMEKVLK